MTCVAVGIGLFSGNKDCYVKSNFCCLFSVFPTGKGPTGLLSKNRPNIQISERESNRIYTVCRQNNDAAHTVPMHGFHPDRT